MNRRNFLKFNALTLASMGVAYANPMQICTPCIKIIL